MNKLTLIIVITLGCISGLSAQTLSFSKVLSVSSTQDTVPAGKVWKVESILTPWVNQYDQSSSCSGNGYYSRRVYVDGTSYYMQSQGIAAGTGYRYMSGNSFPLWLEPGTTLRTHCSEARLSIIEFSVTP